MSEKYHREMVSVVCYELIPPEVIKEIFHAALGLVWERDNVDHLDDLDDQFLALSSLMSHATQDKYSLKKERLIDKVTNEVVA